MNKKKIIAYIILLTSVQRVIADNIFDEISQKAVGKSGKTPTKIFTPGSVQEREAELQGLQERLDVLKKEEKENNQAIQAQLDQVNNQITKLREKQDKEMPETDKAFLGQKLTLLNESYQALIDQKLLYKELMATIEKHIDYIKAYLQDPLFASARVERASFYTFENLQNSNRRIADLEEKVAHVQEQLSNLVAQLDNRKRDIVQLDKQYEEKQREQKEFAVKVPQAQQVQNESEIRREGQLLDLHEQLLRYKTERAKSHVLVLQAKKAYTESRLNLEQTHLKILKEDLLYVIKPALRVTAVDVSAAEKKYQELKQASVERKKGFYQEKSELTTQSEKLKTELETMKNELKLPVGDWRSIDEWNINPQSVKSYVNIIQLGYTNDRLLLVDRRIDLKNANIALEDERLRYEEMLSKGVGTWYKSTNELFETDEEITQEIKSYETIKADLERDLAGFKDRRNTATGMLNIQNVALSNIRKEIDELAKQRDVLFKKDSGDYRECLRLMNEAQTMISSQIDLTGKLIEEYSSIISTVSNSLKQVIGIVGQLSTLSIWKRSAHAITWDGIKNVIPDLGMFTSELYKIIVSYVGQFERVQIVQWLTHMPYYDMLLYFLQICALIFLFFLLRALLPWLYFRFMGSSSTTQIMRILSRYAAFLVGFLHAHLLSLFIWGVLFIYLRLYGATHTAPVIIFYLLSIPYLLYIARSLVKTYEAFNREHDDVLMSQPFSERFVRVFEIFCYATVLILFLRKAVLLVSLVSFPSELPTILAAFYSIIYRALLVFLIGKQEVLSIIPTTTSVWQWIWDKVDRWYYPLLIIIVLLMAMSDPYIGGYGNLVTYFVWGFFWTVIFSRLFIYAHSYIKKISSRIFFKQDADVVRDRFAQAKTWYGLFVIVMFVLIVAAGFFVIAWVWGYTISLKDVWSFFSQPFTKVEGTGPDGRTILIPVNALSFFKIILFIFGGFFLAFSLNKFVFKRIFELLLIESGIQNTVTSIARYLIVVTAIIVGFQAVGLSNFLISLGVLIAGVSWLIQEPIRDFASYFILLVQRPIKIGDYIMVDETIQGIVRKITPRSVILRRKNSFSVIVPNSQVTGRPINNWNYSRNFVAVDDITFTVAYRNDPKFVCDTIAQVIDLQPDLLKSPPPIIRLHRFGDHGYVFLVRVFISAVNVLNQWDIAGNIRLAIVTEFNKKNITMAIPIRLLYRAESSQAPYFGDGEPKEE